mmetsp:Transcript_42572/g.77318  ORF Transcript_42572/g.77318 Transcript_42572/m.77318 type:complete len:349 (-) Transcript_42572:143-1189(-)
MWGLLDAFSGCRAPCVTSVEDCPAERVIAQVEAQSPSYRDDDRHLEHCDAKHSASDCRSCYISIDEQLAEDEEPGQLADAKQVRGRLSTVSTWLESTTVADGPDGLSAKTVCTSSQHSEDLQDLDQEPLSPTSAFNGTDDGESLLEIMDSVEPLSQQAQQKLPEPKAPNKAPVFVEKLDATLADVWAAFAQTHSRPQARLVNEFHHGRSLQATRWEEDSRGDLTRRLSYKMPLSGSSALAAVVSLPEHSQVSSVCRMARTSKEIILQELVTTAGIPLAENFQCLVILSFQELAGGGLQFKKWLEVQWVKPLTWSQKPVRFPLERKATADAVASGRLLHEILRQELFLA